jgi:PPM family protein phosphatase
VGRQVVVRARASGDAAVSTGPSAISVSWGVASHPGNVRALNEDSILAAPPVFVVADGMGGHEGGDVASAVAIDSMRKLGPSPRFDDIARAVSNANATIFTLSSGSERGMGTTLTGLVVGASASGRDVAVLNVGDSRTYRLRGDDLSQLTTDHSYVQELIDSGLLDPNDASDHPERNVVTRALGVDESIRLDLFSVSVAPGDRFLVCSDGLSGELDDSAIARLLQIPGAGSAAEALMSEALAGRASDNVSVIVVDIEAVERFDDPDVTDRRGVGDTTRPRKRRPDITARRTARADHGLESPPSPSGANLIADVPVTSRADDAAPSSELTTTVIDAIPPAAPEDNG